MYCFVDENIVDGVYTILNLYFPKSSGSAFANSMFAATL